MARGDTSAQTAETSANNLSNTYGGNAGALYGSLAPQLQAEAAHPAGYSPSTLSAMNTAGQQSAGGSMAGAVGQGGLLAARTRNAGAPAAAIDSAARSSSAALSKSALGTQTKNADLMQKQQQAGLGGLEGLYGENLSGSTGALGQVAANSNANTNAANASWDWSKDLLSPILGAASSGYGSYEKANSGG
jgi:hypothetical protein